MPENILWMVTWESELNYNTKCRVQLRTPKAFKIGEEGEGGGVGLPSNPRLPVPMVISGVLSADSVKINKTKRSQCSSIISGKALKTFHVACVVLIKYVK